MLQDGKKAVIVNGAYAIVWDLTVPSGPMTETFPVEAPEPVETPHPVATPRPEEKRYNFSTSGLPGATKAGR